LAISTYTRLSARYYRCSNPFQAVEPLVYEACKTRTNWKRNLPYTHLMGQGHYYYRSGPRSFVMTPSMQRALAALRGACHDLSVQEWWIVFVCVVAPDEYSAVKKEGVGSLFWLCSDYRAAVPGAIVNPKETTLDDLLSFGHTLLLCISRPDVHDRLQPQTLHQHLTSANSSSSRPSAQSSYPTSSPCSTTTRPTSLIRSLRSSRSVT